MQAVGEELSLKTVEIIDDKNCVESPVLSQVGRHSPQKPTELFAFEAAWRGLGEPFSDAANEIGEIPWPPRFLDKKRQKDRSGSHWLVVPRGPYKRHEAILLQQFQHTQQDGRFARPDVASQRDMTSSTNVRHNLLRDVFEYRAVIREPNPNASIRSLECLPVVGKISDESIFADCRVE